MMSWDILFVAALFISAALYGFFIGRDRSILILLSTYVAFAVVTNAPIFFLIGQWFPIANNPSVRLGWFLGFFLLIFFVLWRSGLLRTLARRKRNRWQAILLSVLTMALLVVVALFLLPPDKAAGFSPTVRQLFMSEFGRSCWLIAPIVAFAFLHGVDRPPSFSASDEET